MIPLFLLAAPVVNPEQAAPSKPAVLERGAPDLESAAARLSARRCTEDDKANPNAALLACREALRLGLREPRRRALRDLLAARLSAAGRYDEVVELHRGTTLAQPADAAAWRRLGAALLLLKGDAAAARPALEEAARLREDDSEALVLLGLCWSALEKHAEAVAAFEAALQRDPGALRSRPAAEATLEAARRGERWP